MQAPTFDRPLLLDPTLDLKTWGGRRLERLGKQLPPGAVGESLESGPSARVRSGPFEGATLAELSRRLPDDLLGPLGRAEAGPACDFPLLVKFIDACQDLSVQVHPSDSQAPTGKRGKCEAWLVLAADANAELIVGVAGPIDLPRIERQLIRRPARPGDVWLTPPGTVHAIGAGVLLYEIQQPSDVTYRLYDWGRPREIHVEQALAVAREATAAPITPLRLDPTREMLVACRHFALERRQFRGETLLARAPSSCRVLTLLDGDLRLGATDMHAGDSAVLPATLSDMPARGDATTLIAWVPDIEADIVAPLRAAGHPRASIVALWGGVDRTRE